MKRSRWEQGGVWNAPNNAVDTGLAKKKADGLNDTGAMVNQKG